MSSSTPHLSELDPLLASLNELKAPGANKSKIATITAICVKYYASETQIVQSFYRAVKKAPATHKLGALYVIDSVIRQWTGQAKKAGQEVPVEGRPDPGTHAAGLRRIAELMPALLDDTLKVMPNEQIAKLQNLIDIWDRGNFFPRKDISEFKDKLGVAALQSSRGIENAKAGKFKAQIPTRPIQTPIGMPPQHLYDRGFLVQQNGVQRSTNDLKAAVPPPPKPAPQQDVTGILAALAASAPKVQQPPQPVAAAPPPVQAAGIPANILAMLAQQTLQPPAQTYPPQQAPQTLAPPPAYPSSYGMPAYSQMPMQPAVQMPAAPHDPLAPLRGILPANILNDQAKLMQALTLLQELQAGGLPMDQWAPVIQAFSEQAEARGSEPLSRHNGRSRSRSPDRQGRGARGSPGYNSHDERARYRQRSPPRNAPMSVAPAPNSGLAWNGVPMQPKIIQHDPSLPPDSIKVLSRTLFIGGANGSQAEIENLFSRFGRVQTVISNRDKRHAFVKMTTRQSALDAKAGMEQLQSRGDREAMNVARQTKWGVGFGPRECCDYQRGESTIPIYKLTEADVKWLLSAEYGGSGGRELVGGMVLEEPDIEIGAGVSSKAMSKRVGPEDRNHGGGGGGGGGGGKRKKDYRQGGRGSREDAQMGGNPLDHHQFARPEPVAIATPPAVPGFGFTLPG